MVIVIMGVSGVGKTQVGQKVAKHYNLPFYDADDFHPEKNVDKMRKGIPLTDSDRLPWLTLLNRKIGEWNRAEGAVLACSALRESYREILEKGNQVLFIMLYASRKTILERMKKRKGHYMPPGLLDSQINTLEEIDSTHSVSNDENLDETVNEVIRRVRKITELE